MPDPDRNCLSQLPHWKVAICKWLRRVRPAQFQVFLRNVLRIHRIQYRSALGVVYWLDPASHFGMKLISGGFERILTNFIVDFLGPDDVFVDVGANEGYFSALAAAKIPGVKVYALEPQSRLHPVIRRNMDLNNATDSVSIHRLALGDNEGQAELFLRPDTISGASGFQRHWLSCTKEHVPLTTLDRFLDQQAVEHVRFVKIDTEGAEGLVIRGALPILREKRVDVFNVHYHQPHLGPGKTEIERMFANSGYVICQLDCLALFALPKVLGELERMGATVRAAPPPAA